MRELTQCVNEVRQWKEELITARKPPLNLIELRCDNEGIKWVKNYKYLGYWISPRLGWGLMINKTTLKIREKVNMIKRFRLCSLKL